MYFFINLLAFVLSKQYVLYRKLLNKVCAGNLKSYV